MPYQQAISLLFARPAAEHPHPRPTEMMFRAFHACTSQNLKWFGTAESVAGETIGSKDGNPLTVLGKYRQEIINILNADDHKAALTVADLLHSEDVERHIDKGRVTKSLWQLRPTENSHLEAMGFDKRERLRKPIDKNEFDAHGRCKGGSDYAYARISDMTHANSPLNVSQADNGWSEHTCYVGASPDDQEPFHDEKSDQTGSWRELKLNAFDLARCCVTRDQYDQFDAQRSQQHLTNVLTQQENEESSLPEFYDDFGLDRRAREPDCPMASVSWFDTWAFCLWLGPKYELPTEFQREAASWGGIKRDDHKHRKFAVDLTDEPTLADFNFNAYREVSQKKMPRGTLPVRWDQWRTEQQFDGYGWRGKVPSAYGPNDFGLWHMSGNVWDWCRNLWNEDFDGAIAASESHGEEGRDAMSGRSLRGGSWFFDARNCRCSYRYRFEPDDRFYDIGFRVARTRYSS